MCYNISYLIYVIIVLINIKYLKTFNVNFNFNYNLQVEPFNTQIYKRELTQFFDKASYSFNGLQKVESIPVLFPIDICVFSFESSKYATALHMKRNGAKHFSVFKMNNGSYELIADIPSPNSIAMDCIDFNNKGYVAVALNLTKTIQKAKEGSPIYEIVGNRVRAVQYFAAFNLTSVYLRTSGNDFFLLHTYANSQNTPNLHCPYFKWSGSTFNKIGRIPCSNARQLTPFSIDYESYVAVANYADQKGDTSTNSEIYKYSRNRRKFVLYQKIKTYGAVDVQYFNVLQNDAVRRHFLLFGNSISSAPLAKREKAKRGGNNLDADSVFYLFDKGQFIPYQKLSLYAVKKFLPVQNVEVEKFLLLVACTDQDIKIYNFNDWKFEESKVQFTEGAFGVGVSNMRSYQENGNSYLIIANKLMSDNETNIFLPIFKQEQHVNALRQHIIDWAKAKIQLLKANNAKEFVKRVQEKLQNLEQLKYELKFQQIPKAIINTVITESLVHPKLKMSSNYWLALGFVNQALDAMEAMLEQTQRLKRETNLYPKGNLKHVYETLSVENLTVNKDLKVKMVNKVNSSNPEFSNIKAKKVVVSKKFMKPSQERVNSNKSLDYRNENDVIAVKNLQISGKLNDYLWNDLLNNTLKRKEDIQFLKAPVEIETLKADTLIVSDDKVNGQDLGALIPTVGGGKYVINQDLHFAAPITINKLQIFERLNKLHVFNGQFDVLLKRSNESQVIEGLKNVTNIKVMDKIIYPQLEAKSPNKFIAEALVLQGNYIINGDVYIDHLLNALDLIDLNEKLSTQQILDMAVRVDKGLRNVNLKFQQPLMANNSLISFVSQHDLQRLVKLNYDDIQVIEGTKVFNKSLEIKTGFSEVKNLNGINIEKLENNAFLKNNNQTIEVPMKIGKISTKCIQSPLILLNSKNLSDYLTLNGNQTIQGSLIIENLKAQFLIVDHLNTDSKIFQQKLQNIYRQKSRNAPPKDLFKQNRKFHGSIYVQNVIINFTINSKSVEVIENQILQLEGNIKYVGNFKFNYPMKIINMTFEGKLNDIKSEEFGKSWLQKKADKQVFTAAQTFATINAEEGIRLRGKLNGFSMEEFYTKTYWTNRSEFIQCLNFENPLEISGNLTTKTLNDYMMPLDVFYKHSKERSSILKSMTVNENLIVDGDILNLNYINNLKLNDLQEFLDGFTDKTLYVENAYFSQSPPIYKTLNGHYLGKTLDSVWMTNENVILPHRVEITDANFEGLLEFKGSINNINVKYLEENYFSKTKQQNISVDMIFSKGVEVEKEINVKEMKVFGALIEDKSEISFNFDEFVQNTLKTSGPHIITGKWSLPEAIIEGNLNKVLINQLNLLDDTLLKINLKKTYQIKAPKIFNNVNIENLYADAKSFVNRIPVDKWIKEAVYLYENYTIKGVTSIDAINVYNNLIVLGKLNNITFDEYNILLQNKNQNITGRMKIVSHLARENRFLTINIEQLYADYINQQHMPSFIDNLIPVAPTMEIKSHLSFKQDLTVERYEGPEGILAENPWAKRSTDKQKQLNRPTTTTGKALMDFNDIKDYLNNVTKNPSYKLNHFDIVQTIETMSANLLMLSLKIDTSVVDILAVIQHKNITYYKWIPKENKFRITTEFNWLPQDALLLEIIYERFVTSQQPTDAKSVKTFIRQDLQIFYKLLFNTKNKGSNYFEFSNDTCIKFQNNQPTSMELCEFCLNTDNPKNILHFNDNVQQIMGFGKKYFAVLANSSVLIFDISLNPAKMIQKLATNKPKQLALGFIKKSDTFLAVLNGAQSNTINYGFLEIYRSVNSSAFTLFQSLKCLAVPTQIKISFIEKSNDLLIHLLSDSLIKPYIVYQYQGVKGFQEILLDSILAENFAGLNIFKLYSSRKYLVSLSGLDKTTLIELAMKQI